MAIINRIAGFADDMTEWRRHLHAHPELGFDCTETAAFVAERLRAFGVDEIHEGIARTGLVAIIEGSAPGPTIGLRADMDALPITEATGAAHASTRPGNMHACGRDGHTTMLLGAARYLAETRRFSGRVALIFQPAEEAGNGGEAMCDAGILDNFEISQVFALHTSPGHEQGTFHTCAGPIMAAVDEFEILIEGLGGHGAFPFRTRDPVAGALQLGQALQTIVARNVDSGANAVLSLTQIHTGSTHNVVPENARLGGTIRTYEPQVRQTVLNRVREICDGIGTAMNLTVTVRFPESLPPTVNDPDATAFATAVARDLAGPGKVSDTLAPRPGGEDFSFMLERRPGAFVFIGQGEGPFVHDPAFDFNDEIAPLGASYFARLVETAQPLA
ncbi:MAG: M20 family metallopeptidase [Rhodobacteraceae bacterium]|nr:M20 family metallopeptidase [Paracoccaceae bacterium]